MRLCIYKCCLACIVILDSVSGIFRHIRALFKSILTQIQNLVYPCISLKDAILYGVFNIIFRHILACSRFIQPYLFLLRHIKNPSILRNILLLHIIFRQIQHDLGPRLISVHYVSGIFSHITLDILRYICQHSGIFW